MPLHWHPSENHATATAACESVKCLSGSLCVFTAQGLSGGGYKIGSTGMSVTFAPGQRVFWSRPPSRDPRDPLTVDLVADHTLWRNICSAVLDRDIFPQLRSTPLWLKALFAVLAAVPAWRNGLLSLMLWFQLQTVFYAHDFRVYHGYIHVTWPWIAQPFGSRPPVWAQRLQLQSMYVIARVVMATAYWTGTLFLGMRGEYVEYTPRRDNGDEKR
jgi:hypothetical protein